MILKRSFVAAIVSLSLCVGLSGCGGSEQDAANKDLKPVSPDAKASLKPTGAGSPGGASPQKASTPP